MPEKVAGIKERSVADQIPANRMCETQPVYCAHCGHFLGNQAILMGAVEFKCPAQGCKKWTIISIMPDGLDNAAEAVNNLTVDEAVKAN